MDFVSNVTNDFNQIDIVNKGFLFVHQLFTQSNSGWYLSENQFGHICYTRKGYETDIFEIKLDRNKIYVTIPIKNSPFQYKTSFTDYSSASDYLEQRFYDFND